ncbi:CheR family methyltransferase [Roseateles koreensis]|uniref:Chemotaxis protein methyltransferase n=1 Tax=Roseateles koreensis TaxID=2987526 RepID=A0ABT5KT27_9BURK|nr:protein-glutamate O-methyltransferase CheR [Roseateles koreensis]MDC8785575.1 protein-glutamate O-methyltransferase CheR [Roseateles koreensis]
MPRWPGRHGAPTLSAEEFDGFRRFLYDEAGIALADSKKALVQSRLAKRLRQLGLTDFASYWQLLHDANDEDERQQAVNALSTHETYFFREPQPFAWLQAHVSAVAAHGRRPLRLWSAACATGEEAYTLAMLVADCLGVGGDWEVWGTDINTQVLAHARLGVYDLARVQRTPKHLWRRYFQYGRDDYQGKVRVRPELAKHLRWQQVNLLNCNGLMTFDFDVIFLRNVMIYFNAESRALALNQVCQHLRPEGYLLIGQSENLHAPGTHLQLEAPKRLRKVQQLNEAGRLT